MTERSAARRAARVGARSAIAVVGIAIGAAVVAGAGLIPWPHVGVTPLSSVVTPTPIAQQLDCPGSTLRLGSTSGQDADTATSVQTPTLASTTPSKVALSGPGHPAVVALQDTGVVAAAQSETLATSEFSGLATAACTEPSSDSWLVGGATTTGRTTLVTLGNSSAVDATVDLTVYTEKGQVDAPGATGIVVQAGHQRVLSLAGFAPGAVAPVVHVTSSGGFVSAALQVSISRGVLPSGIDTVTPTSSPSERLVIPGLTIRQSDDNADNVANRISQDASGEADLSTVLRLYATGAAASATITVLPEGGDVKQGATVKATVKAGVVTEVPLDGLQTGAYVVTVETDHPVVGALRSSVASTPKPQAGTTDVAWFPVPSTISVPTAVAVPWGASPSLHIANDGTAAATVDLGSGGKVTVPAHGAAHIDLKPGVYSLATTKPISATVTYSSDSQLAAILVQPRAADADPVTVWPAP